MFCKSTAESTDRMKTGTFGYFLDTCQRLGIHQTFAFFNAELVHIIRKDIPSSLLNNCER